MKNIEKVILYAQTKNYTKLKRYLKEMGFEVYKAECNEDKLFKLIKKVSPDIVLFEINNESLNYIDIDKKINSSYSIPTAFFITDKIELDENILSNKFLLNYVFNKIELYTSLEMVIYRHKMEQKFKKDNQLLITILNNLGEAVLATDENGYITYLNPYAEEFLNYKINDCLGVKINNIIKIIHNQTNENIDDIISSVIHNKNILRFNKNFTIFSKCSNFASINLTISPIINEYQEVKGIIFIFSDITETIKLEKALFESEDKYRKLVELCPDLISINQNNKIIFINENGAKILGANSSEELIGKDIASFFHPDNFNLFLDRISKIKETGEIVPSIQEKFLRLDGALIYLEISSIPIIYEGKQAFLVYAKDITKYKEIEEKLSENERRFRELADFLPQIVFEINLNGDITFINKKAYEMFGYKPEDFSEGQKLNVLDFLIPEDVERAKKNILARIKDQAYCGSNEYTFVRKDKTTFPVIVHSAPIVKNNEIIGLRGVIFDITERKKKEEELLKSQKLESIGFLAGGIAHDFNNLLTAILGNVSFAKMLIKNDEKILNILTKIENASLNAKQLTEQLLIFSKGGDPVKKTVNVKDLITDISITSLTDINIQCDINIPDDIWNLYVDENQILKALNNIILNAIQSMVNEKKLEISFKNELITYNHPFITNLEAGKYVVISIRDYGCGIAEENITKIFDPYFTTKSQNFGLGLAISYSIVKKHNGYIHVESKINEGTTFHIYLPASDEDINSDNVNLQNIEITDVNKKILLMDDEDFILETSGEILKFLGYDVEFARDGEEAIKKYKEALELKQPFDLIIMDLIIPKGMGGKEAIQKIKEIDPNVIAIVSSGYSSEPVMAEYQKYGFKDVLPKPYKIEELKDILIKVLNNK